MHHPYFLRIKALRNHDGLLSALLKTMASFSWSSQAMAKSSKYYEVSHRAIVE